LGTVQWFRPGIQQPLDWTTARYNNILTVLKC
jgi:hypothetical protein